MKQLVPLALATALATPLVAVGDDLDRCRRLVESEGPSERATECYFLSSREQSDLARTARTELTELLATHPREPWLHFYLGRLPPWRDHGGPHLKDAALLFEAQGQLSPATRALSYLVTWHMLWYSWDGRPEDLEAAEGHLASLEAVVARSSIPQDKALLKMARAHILMLKAEDLERARLLLQAAYESLQEAPEVHRHELKECLRSLAHVADLLGLSVEAQRWARRNLTLAIEEGRPRDQASASYDLVLHRVLSQHPTDSRRKSVVTDLYSTLEIAQRAGHTWVEAATRALIAQIEGGPEAEAHLETCIELAGSNTELKRRCMKALAAVSLESDPQRARRILEQTDAEEQGFWMYLDGWEDQMRVIWATESPDEAVERIEVLLSLFEALRRNQVGEATDRLLSQSADAYYGLAGRLLEIATDTAPQPTSAIEKALSVIERLRSQTLREALLDARQPKPTSETTELLQAVDRRYAEITRELFSSAPDTSQRNALLSQLDGLEQEAARIRRATDDADPEIPIIEPPGTDLMSQLQAELRPDEALLSFQIGLQEDWSGHFAGGSWLLVITSNGVQPYRLEADRARLDPAVRALRARADPEDEQALAALHRLLFDTALSDLPDDVRRLVVVPDGILHLLPFGLLREAEGSKPLVERYEIQIVPSASVWLHWRKDVESSLGFGSGAFVLANPLLFAGGAPASARGASLATVATLGPLPYAEREGKRVLRSLGGHGRLERREQASERLVKTTDLSAYRIVHFAAHAYLDLQRPSLSGLVLAAGGEQEDGLLRPSEIARLSGLEDKLIVLAACDTAAGEVLRGEGVLSIARAFFQAGAESVVASLWRIDDRQATEFFDDFYDRLSAGASVGQALSQTQAEWSSFGRPASVWAGFVALGNGDFVPLPDGVPAGGSGRYAAVAGLVGFLALAAFLLVRRRDRL